MEKKKVEQVKRKGTTSVSSNPDHEYIFMNADGSTSKGANLHALITNRKR